MRLFLVSGERSGDRHGAGLMAELRALAPEVRFFGLGGPEMRALSDGIDDWVEEAGVVGLVEVLRKYGWFRRRFRMAREEIERLQPEAVILIDYPGFNLRLARALRAQGYRGRIIYYISPQVWAWRRGRIPEMARCLDLMLCLFPFEKPLYEGSGLPAVFTGHPLADPSRRPATAAVRDPDLIGLLPGSRRREVTKHFPPLLEAVRLMHAISPALRFEASAASPPLASLMKSMKERAGVECLTIETGHAESLMQRACCGAVASGTATLEAAIHGLPYCLIYKVSTGTYWVARALMRVPFLGIVNLMAGKAIVKELLQRDCNGPAIAAELRRLHDGPPARAEMVAGLEATVAMLDGHGAYRRAAEAVLERLATRPCL